MWIACLYDACAAIRAQADEPEKWGKRIRSADAHVRCTTRPTAPLRAHAQRAVRAYGQRGCAAPQGRTPDGAAVSQRTTYDCKARARCAGRRIINACRDSSRAVIMMTSVVMNSDTYQQRYQSTRVFSPLINSLKCVCPDRRGLLRRAALAGVRIGDEGPDLLHFLRLKVRFLDDAPHLSAEAVLSTCPYFEICLGTARGRR